MAGAWKLGGAGGVWYLEDQVAEAVQDRLGKDLHGVALGPDHDAKRARHTQHAAHLRPLRGSARHGRTWGRPWCWPSRPHYLLRHVRHAHRLDKHAPGSAAGSTVRCGCSAMTSSPARELCLLLDVRLGGVPTGRAMLKLHLE